jgi:hypothetical protein
MANLTIRIRPSKSETTLRRQHRGFFARLTQSLYRARMSKLMLGKTKPSAERRRVVETPSV